MPNVVVAVFSKKDTAGTDRHADKRIVFVGLLTTGFSFEVDEVSNTIYVRRTQCVTYLSEFAPECTLSRRLVVQVCMGSPSG